MHGADTVKVVKRAGGWFVTGEEWSGPWNTKEAADLASNGEYTLAHIEHRKAPPVEADGGVEAMQEQCAKVNDDAADRVENGPGKLSRADELVVHVLRGRAAAIRALPVLGVGR